jgi:hypothetical protein
MDRHTPTTRVKESLTAAWVWVLPAGVDNLPPELKVSPASGELAARSDVRVLLEFSALEKKDLSESLRLEVGANAGWEGCSG